MRAYVGIVLAMCCGAALAAGALVTGSNSQCIKDSSGHCITASNGHVVTSSKTKAKSWTADSSKVTADSSYTADGGKMTKATKPKHTKGTTHKKHQ